MEAKDFYEVGVKLGALAKGVNPDVIPMVSGVIGTIENRKEAGYGNLQRLMCKYAATAYCEAGKHDSFQQILFTKLAHTPKWYPELEPFADAVFVAIGKMYKEAVAQKIEQENDELVEKAAKIIPSVAAKALTLTPEAIKFLSGIGVVGGAGVGSLVWLMNRHAKEDDDKLEAMKAKVHYYNKLTNEIDAGLKSKPPTRPADVRQTIDDII